MGVEAGEGEDDHRLHQLGRLEPDEAEVEPALGAAADEAERLRVRMQQQDPPP